MTVPPDDDRTLPADTPPPGSSSPRPSAAGTPRPGERFAPGVVLLDRYRILGRVGTGGMGEVYRADDLTLEQEVALKFLPADVSDDPELRRRFLQEARLARQVAHPNVCRVYDVGECEGQPFLSMEFVAGRDLASVLRSIGRLPQEKAIDIARQLCAGLAALHDRGVLHRDLKPANVMLDEDGRVRITDFGLAGVVDRVHAGDMRSGTPRYMAPEQLAGREVTPRSDIYALGLVLYEVFTGKPPFTADSVEKLAELHRSATPSRLSSHVTDIDPAVERIIDRCLAKDPARRPATALLVATALPGGDPLAAALAMGDTPSPELVAAAGGKGGLHPAVGLLLLAVALVGLLVQAGAFGPRNLVHHLDLDRPAGALEERARQLVADLGYDERPVDRQRGFWSYGALLRWLAEQDSSQARWDALGEVRPAPMIFWYRQSPRYLLTQNPLGGVMPSDPPPTQTDMVQVMLDAQGRLISFSAVPPETSLVAPTEAAPTVAPERWQRLLRAAGLEPAELTPIPPSWYPAQFATERLAWQGNWLVAGQEVTVTAEAGGVDGRPVYFRLDGPWSGPFQRTARDPQTARGIELVVVLVVLGVLAGGASLAIRNHRRGRTDARGAGRLAALVLVLPVISWLFRSHHAPLPDALLDRFFMALSLGSLYAVVCLLLYFALEPFVRRTWPQMLIGWSRLAAGGWRDPLVGRSVLLGGAMFGLSALSLAFIEPLHRALDLPPPVPVSGNWSVLASGRTMIGDLAIRLPAALFNALFFLMLLVLLRLLVRRTWLTYLLFGAGTVMFTMAQSVSWQIGLMLAVPIAILWTVTLVRGGILAFAVGLFMWFLLSTLPLTLDVTQMYVTPSLLLIGAIVLLLAGALSTALGGRSLLAEDLDRDC
jgi:predicted Ser/Thr protein kinase